MKMRVGILTSGGDCPGLNATIRGVAKALYQRMGDKVEIIPNHICPVVNLHETAYLVTDGEVVEEIPVACRGKLK